MNHKIIIISVAVLASAASAQTNAVHSQAEALSKRIEDHIKQGLGGPIPFARLIQAFS